MKITGFIFLLLCNMICIVQIGYCQNLYLVKKGKEIGFYGGTIGLTTKTDTIRFERHHQTGEYRIAGFDERSITIRRPKTYRDTLVIPGQYQSPPPLPYNYSDIRVAGKVKKEHKKYYSIIIINEYEYKTYEYRDITSVQYPPEAGETTGCIFCPFIPIYNIYFIKCRGAGNPKPFICLNGPSLSGEHQRHLTLNA